jgi:acyl dehydratase
MSFRTPAYEGDVTYVDGEVVEKQFESSWGVPLVTIKLTMTNQDGVVVVDGFAEVELPL